MQKESRKKYLLKNTLIFSIGNFGSKIINFLLVPLYTNILTKGEYGTLDLIHVIGMVLVPIITLNISESIMRFSMDKTENKEEILSIGILISLMAIILATVLLPFMNMIDITSNYSVLLVFYMIFLSTSTIFLCYIRGIEKLLDYSIISIIQTLSIALLNILFLVYYKLGVSGYILAYTISYIITTIIAVIRGNVLKTVKRININKKLFRNMTKYSLLLIPNSLMWWIMNSLDRVMVTKMISIEANGLYAVSYKIPTILITITTIFNQAWMYSAVKEKDSMDKSAYTNKVYNSLSTCVVSIACLLLIILKPLFKIYVGKSFYLGWIYTPPLLIGTIFLTLSTFISNEYTVNKDSAGFLKSSTIGATINLILNFILINKIGVMGASIATCISYIAVFIFRSIDTRKYVKIDYFNTKNILSVFIVLLVSLSIYIDNPYIYIVLVLLTLLLFVINQDFWKTIINNFKKIIKERRK